MTTPTPRPTLARAKLGLAVQPVPLPTCGVIFRILEDGLGSWLVLVLSARLFGLGHLNNSEATW
jgi:hypothetical protein